MSSLERGPSRIDVHAIVQATEDEGKVKTAIGKLFPEHIRNTLKFERTRLRGHYHNPIIRLEVRLTRRALVRETLEFIGQRFLPAQRKLIATTFETRINQKGHLFLRFDKQESYQGRIRLINRGDSLRLVIRFSGQKVKLSDLENYYRKLNLI